MGYGYGWGGAGPRGPGGGRGRGYGRGGRWGWATASGVQPLPQLPPPPPGSIRVVAAVEIDRGLDSPIAMRFARAPYIAVVDIAGGRVVDLKIIPNTYAAGAGGVGVAVAQWILSIGATIVLGPPLGPNATMVLQQAGIRMIPMQPGIPLRNALHMAGLAIA